MDEFVYDFFKARTTGPASAVIEAGYNFVHALKRFSYDADCDLLLMIFLGETSEEVYKDQLRCVFDLNKLFFMMDVLHGEGGRLPKRVIRTALRAFFSKKSEARLAEIVTAVDMDSPGTHAAWHKLFEEDPGTLSQSHFVEAVRGQMLDERLEFFQSLAGGSLRTSTRPTLNLLLLLLFRASIRSFTLKVSDAGACDVGWSGCCVGPWREEDVLYSLTSWKEPCTRTQIEVRPRGGGRGPHSGGPPRHRHAR